MLDAKVEIRVRAVIHDEAERVLCIQHRRKGRSYWTLPGGGPRENERLDEALAREVSEETGYVARIGDLIGVGEVRAITGKAPRVVIFFRATIVSQRQPTPTLREQLDVVEWWTGEQINHQLFHPRRALELFSNWVSQPVYLGDITDEME
jgi:8-oxo-dGTP diphosphatase